jgi:hypothetical protein
VDFNKLQYADDSLFDQSHFEKELSKFSQFKNEKILISDENFSGKSFNFSYINRSIIARRLSKSLGRATPVILFVRNQKEITFSFYNQWVKSGHLKGYRGISKLFWHNKKAIEWDQLHSLMNDESILSQDYLYFNTNGDFIHLDSFKYSKIIECYRKYFDNIHVFSFEELSKDLKSVLKRLSAILDCEIPSIPKKAALNKSLSKSELIKRQYFNKYPQNLLTHPLFRRLIAISFKLREQKLAEQQEQEFQEFSDMIKSYYRMDNQLLMKLVSRETANYIEDY